MSGGVAHAIAERAVAVRYEAAAAEVRRLIDAGLEVMRQGGSLDPRVSDIVKAAGLSNQAFYRHFRSKEELLLAILDDGVVQLVGYLEHRMRRASTPLEQVRAWVEGIMAQAAHADAAEASRPFANTARLADAFPDETRRSIEALKEPLRRAIADARDSGDAPDADPDRDGEAIYAMAIGMMQEYLVIRSRPSRADVEAVATFAVRGLGGKPSQ